MKYGKRGLKYGKRGQTRIPTGQIRTIPWGRGLRRQTQRNGDTERFWMGSLLEEPSRMENVGQTRLTGTFFGARSSSLQNLRVSFLRALRVWRRRQRGKEDERSCSMCGRSLSDRHSGQTPNGAAPVGASARPFRAPAASRSPADGEGAVAMHTDAQKRVPPRGATGGGSRFRATARLWKTWGKSLAFAVLPRCLGRGAGRQEEIFGDLQAKSDTGESCGGEVGFMGGAALEKATVDGVDGVFQLRDA